MLLRRLDEAGENVDGEPIAVDLSAGHVPEQNNADLHLSAEVHGREVTGDRAAMTREGEILTPHRHEAESVALIQVRRRRPW